MATTQLLSTKVRGLKLFCKNAMLFIKFSSRRRLAYVKPRIDTNQFEGETFTYEGVGSTMKWEHIESNDLKFVENIVQAISHGLLCYTMKNLRHCFIVGYVHDELSTECYPR